jgi:hypothetical protein
VRRRAAALGRAAGIEDPGLSLPPDLRPVRVAVDQGVAAFESGEAARLVHHADPRLPHFEYPSRRQHPLQLLVVHVPVHGLERPEPAELLVDLSRDEVACVEDQIGLRQPAQAFRGQPAGASRKVRVGDDRNERQLRRAVFFFAFGSPTRNALPTKLDVRTVFISAASRTPNT